MEAFYQSEFLLIMNGKLQNVQRLAFGTLEDLMKYTDC